MPRRVVRKSAAGSYEKAEKRVENDGFHIPERPGDEVPGLPADITDLDDRALVRCMSEQTAWLEYTGVRLARAEIEERELDLEVVRHQSGLIVASWGGTSKDRVRVARAEADADQELVDLREKHLTAQAYRKILQNLYEACERRVSLFSRELTRRTSMEPYQKRTRKYGGA